MLWGGLRPIPTQVALDTLTLASWTYAVSAGPSRRNGAILLLGCLVTVATSGFTNRWTLTIPMLPLLFFQALRRCAGRNRWFRWMLFLCSILTVCAAAALTVLFPAVELPPMDDGTYHVGTAHIFLPVNTTSTCPGAEVCPAGPSHVTVKFWYPTLEPPERTPYLKPKTAMEFCKQTMRFGAPGPLKSFGWMLHTWRLTHVQVKPQAKPIQTPGLPMVVYSHGMGSNADVYSYQTMALAAHRGAVVASVEHTDGSATVVETHTGDLKTMDFDVIQLWHDGKYEEYARARRASTDWRVLEFLAATEAFRSLNERNIPELESLGISFEGLLNVQDIHFMGHSWGATTALTAAQRRPDLVSSVLAHEPFLDWAPDDTRRSLLPEDRVAMTPYEFTGGTGGYEDPDANITYSVHEKDLLFLFSHEWRMINEGSSHILEEFHQQGLLGRKDGVSTYGVVADAHHSEFADTCMLTPLWLARETGVTGKRNPLETAREIRDRTLSFLDSVRALNAASN